MARIIAIANSKGGVAKTTTTLGLGCALAEAGKRVLLVDLDHQSNLSDDVGRGDEDYTITDLFEDPKFDTNRIIYPALDDDKEIPNLWIIPADITLAVEARSAERFRHRLSILEDGLKRIKQDMDFILIDCRPAIDLSIENALLIAHQVIIPVDMDRRATKGIEDLLKVIEDTKRANNFVYSLVLTKVDQRNAKMLSSTKDRINKAGWPVFTTEIRTSELFKQATEAKRPAVRFAQGQRPHQDYMALASELLERRVN